MHAATRARAAKYLRQTLAGGERRDERESAAFQVFDRSHLWKRRMRERVERGDAIAKGILKSWRSDQFRTEAQQLQRRGAAVVEHEQPIADAVRDAFCVPACERSRSVFAAPRIDG